MWDSHKDKHELQTTLAASAGSDSVLCRAHSCSVCTQQGLTEISLDSFADHAHLIVSLDFSNNVLQSLPADFFGHFPSLSSLALSHNRLQMLPPGVGRCDSLTFLDVSFNRIASLPGDFADVAAKTLQVLVLSGNPLFALPQCVIGSTGLRELYANQIGVEELPDTFPEHGELTVLHLADNAICQLPPSFANLTQLVDLDLSSVKWIESHDSKASVTPASFLAFINANPLLERVDKKVCNVLDAVSDRSVYPRIACHRCRL